MFLNNHSHQNGFLLGSLVLVDPRPRQEHVGLEHAVLRSQQNVARPKARFKHISPEKSELDVGAIRCQHLNSNVGSDIFERLSLPHTPSKQLPNIFSVSTFLWGREGTSRSVCQVYDVSVRL